MDLKEIEQQLDSRNSKASAPRKGSHDSSLVGWSPHSKPAAAPAAAALEQDMQSLDLGAAAAAASDAPVRSADLRADTSSRVPAAAAQAKKPKMTKAERRELQDKQRIAKYGPDVSGLSQTIVAELARLVMCVLCSSM